MHLSIGDLIAIVAWLGFCLVIRHEWREQRRSNGMGWGGPR